MFQNFSILDALGGDSSKNEYPFWLEICKYIWCTIYVTCCCIIVIYGMAVGFTILQVFPLVLYIILALSITLLGYCEALHYGVVAIEKWDMIQYKDKFPRAYACWLLAPTAGTLLICDGKIYLMTTVIVFLQRVWSVSWLVDSSSLFSKSISSPRWHSCPIAPSTSSVCLKGLCWHSLRPVCQRLWSF